MRSIITSLLKGRVVQKCLREQAVEGEEEVETNKADVSTRTQKGVAIYQC